VRPENRLPSPAPEAPAASGRIDINSDDWPVVRVSYHGEISLRMLHDAAQQYAALADRARTTNQRLRWLVNLDDLDARPADAMKRRKAAEILTEYAPRIAAGTLAEARVVESRVIRGIVTAVTWFARQPWPIQVFATEHEAEAWLRERAGTAVPPAQGEP